jgi:hypothetical protein
LVYLIKYLYFAFILIFIIHLKSSAQNDSIKISKNSYFIEITGIGGYGSINYERLTYIKDKFKCGIRLGLSSYNLNDFRNRLNPDLIVPLFINSYYGNKHNIEFGAGQVFTNTVHVNFDNNNYKRLSNFHSAISIGYRYQKKTGGLVFRCSYTPIFESNKYFKHWAGISFGYSF